MCSRMGKEDRGGAKRDPGRDRRDLGSRKNKVVYSTTFVLCSSSVGSIKKLTKLLQGFFQ